MKLETVVSFRVGETGDDEALERLQSILGGHPIEAGTWEIRFGRGDHGLHMLIEALEMLDLAYERHDERTFRRREISGAVALRLYCRETARARSSQGRCRCDIREQDGDHVVIERPPARQTGISLTTDGHILVNELVARKMIGQHISGCLLRDAWDEEGRSSGFFELTPTSVLPPLHAPPSRLARDPEARCDGCGTQGLTLSSLLYYDIPEQTFADVNVSLEQFAASRGLRRGIVVSQRLYRMLKPLGGRGLQAEPVVLV